MKSLAIIFSIITLLLLVLDNVDFSKQGRTENETTSFLTDASLQIKPISKKPSATELKWQTIIDSNGINTSDVELENKNHSGLITIGNDNYKIIGIFNDSQSPFILVKTLDNQSIKLTEGSTLSGGYMLTEISNNSVVLTNNQDKYEFKLFNIDENAKK